MLTKIVLVFLICCGNWAGACILVSDVLTCEVVDKATIQLTMGGENPPIVTVLVSSGDAGNRYNPNINPILFLIKYQIQATSGVS